MSTSELGRPLRSQMLIGTEWVDVASGGALDHVNPATGEVQQEIPVAGRAEVDAAVAAARAALPGWWAFSLNDRADVLRRASVGLKAASAELGIVVARESGTPLRLARTAAGRAARHFDYFAGWVDKAIGGVYPVGGGLNYTLLEPFGVVAALHAWNSPLGLIGMKVAPALAAGCTVIIKAPEAAPFSSIEFGQICLDAGFPPGVVTVVTGGPETGDLLVRHPDIDKVTFTGGPEIAKRIQASCAESLTPLVLELGGKSANLVFDDAVLDYAVEVAANGFTFLSGQACVAPTRLLVQESIYEEFQRRIVARVDQIVVGDPMSLDAFMGPLISRRACERVLGVIEAARDAGDGQLIAGGGRPDGDLGGGGYVAPTVFADVDPASGLARNEIFGPVLAITPFRTEEDAIRLATDSEFGLAAYVQTTNLGRAHRMASALQAGNIGVNGAPTVNAPIAPFGGFKDSGYGKEGALEGLMEFHRIKNVNIAVE